MGLTPARRRVMWFIVTGGAAAAVHLASVVLLVERAGWAPLLANVAGWLIAFAVSFGGHRHLSFADQAAPPARALRRFFAVSALGFAINEAAYAWLLHGGALGYRVALAAVLVGVALLTWLLSRHWAFLGSR